MLSGARRPLATGRKFNKSNKAFIWLAAHSLELSWPERHYLIHRITCAQGRVGRGPGAGSAGWLGQAEAVEACTTHKGDRWCLGQCPKTWMLVSALPPILDSQLVFGQSLDTSDLHFSSVKRQD